jgi:hypothetical protein
VHSALVRGPWSVVSAPVVRGPQSVVPSSEIELRTRAAPGCPPSVLCPPQPCRLPPSGKNCKLRTSNLAHRTFLPMSHVPSAMSHEQAFRSPPASRLTPYVMRVVSSQLSCSPVVRCPVVCCRDFALRIRSAPLPIQLFVLDNRVQRGLNFFDFCLTPDERIQSCPLSRHWPRAKSSFP